jgi:hypothetical protein
MLIAFFVYTFSNERTTCIGLTYSACTSIPNKNFLFSQPQYA